MKALSIRQPWAWLIIRPDLVDLADRAAAFSAGLIKDVENRSWHTKLRGRFLVHAAQGMTRAEYIETLYFVESIGSLDLMRAFPKFDQLQRGGIIGSVELVDSAEASDSPWYMGEKAFVLRDPQPLPFQPLKGRLGFFDVEAPQ